MHRILFFLKFTSLANANNVVYIDMSYILSNSTHGKSILEELFQETRYVLVDNNADFVASLEIVYLGKPNEAFSIIGLFNRRNTSTEMSVLLNVKNKPLIVDILINDVYFETLIQLACKFKAKSKQPRNNIARK